jgi:hypothetical protein
MRTDPCPSSIRSIRPGACASFRKGRAWGWGPRARSTRTPSAAAPAPAAARPPNPKTAFGAQKPDLSLIPPVALHHCALAFENGAAKYGPFNWRENSVEARTYVAASLRHLCDWLDGAEHSSDTSPPVHNLGHVMACCAILLDAQELGNLIDDRPLPGKSADVLERLKASKVRAAQARADTVRDEGPE